MCVCVWESVRGSRMNVARLLVVAFLSAQAACLFHRSSVLLCYVSETEQTIILSTTFFSPLLAPSVVIYLQCTSWHTETEATIWLLTKSHFWTAIDATYSRAGNRLEQQQQSNATLQTLSNWSNFLLRSFRNFAENERVLYV